MASQREPIEAAPWQRHLVEHIEACHGLQDAETVHQVRVAAARLDVWLRIGRRRMLRDDLRWLRHSASRVRDFDVLLERSWPVPIVECFASERVIARQHLLTTLDASRCAALLGALTRLAPVQRKDALAFVERERRKVERRGKAFEKDARSVEDVHRLRRAARRVRYGLEWLGRKSRALKALQDELGRLTDTSVALAELDRCPQALEFVELRAETERALELAFDDALNAWRDTDIEADEDNDA